MSNLLESAGRTRAIETRRVKLRHAQSLWALLFVLSCGVVEHPHEQVAAATTVGGKFAPPPLTAEGGTPATASTPPASALGGSAFGGMSAGSGAPSGGIVGAGGSNGTSGGFSTGGGMLGSPGGVPSAGGSVGSGGTTNATGGRATGGVSGIMVDINGTLLPKESVIGFIHLGHSNMAGRSSSPTGSRAYHFTEMNLRAWVYRAGAWSPALEPNTAGDADAKRFNRGGPGTALLKQAVDLAPNRYFVSMGFGIGSAYCSQFLPGGLYYSDFMAAPMALKGKVTFGAIIIMLGITERHGTAADISGYPQCINRLVTGIRNDLAEPNLPVLITEYEMGSTGPELSPDGTFAQQIIPQIRMVPSVVSNSALVPTDSIAMQDDHHFDLDGQKTWAGRVLSVMKTKGWFPW